LVAAEGKEWGDQKKEDSFFNHHTLAWLGREVQTGSSHQRKRKKRVKKRVRKKQRQGKNVTEGGETTQMAGGDSCQGLFRKKARRAKGKDIQ